MGCGPLSAAGEKPNELLQTHAGRRVENLWLNTQHRPREPIFSRSTPRCFTGAEGLNYRHYPKSRPNAVDPDYLS